MLLDDLLPLPVVNNTKNQRSLKDILNLERYPFCYIQKLLRSKAPFYVVTYNSRRAHVPIARKKIINSHSIKFKKLGKHIALPVKLSFPILINEQTILPRGAIVIYRDIGADMYLYKNKNTNKV